MAAYFVIDLTVQDAQKLEQYEHDVLDLVRKHGGDYDVIEGSRRPDRLVVARYPSRQAISDFYNDPDYVPLKKLREEGSTAAALAVEGSTWEGGQWGFGLYLYSSGKYEDQILPTGRFTGTPEQALDCACTLYLSDPTR